MTGAGDPSDLDTSQVVTRGETYTHLEHGDVTVTSIWRGTDSVDVARLGDDGPTPVVRYLTEAGSEWVDEFTETVDEFFDAIE